MQNDSLTAAKPSHGYARPIWTLLLLAPFIAEVLSGATRVSTLFAYVPEVMVWGVGALLCRELVRRWKAGGASLLMLGLALSVAEEFIIQQTSIAPLPFPGADPNFGRAFGVNWVYFLFMLGFESVWVVLVPVQFTELMFPGHRDKPWLRRRGLIGSCALFLVGCGMAWYAWTQRARVVVLHAPIYRPPTILLAAGFGAIALLVFAAYLLRGFGHAGRVESRYALNPWAAGIAVFVLCVPWWELITLVFVPRPGLQPSVPLAGGVAWAALLFALILYWTGSRRWDDIRRWSLAFGATFALMPGGYMSLAGWSRVDLIGKAVFQILAILGFLLLGRRIVLRRRAEVLLP